MWKDGGVVVSMVGCFGKWRAGEEGAALWVTLVWEATPAAVNDKRWDLVRQSLALAVGTMVK